jgi:hypothetical protein
MINAYARSAKVLAFPDEGKILFIIARLAAGLI